MAAELMTDPTFRVNDWFDSLVSSPAKSLAGPLLVGLTGPAGVGKSTVGAALAKLTDRQKATIGELHSIARPLKKFLEGLGVRKGQETFRPAAQSLSILRETVSPDVYVKAALENCKSWSAAIMVIVDDIRFPQEIEWLKENFARHAFFRLVREYESPLVGGESSHLSESFINELDVDYTVDNNRAPHDAASDIWKLLQHAYSLEQERFYVAGPLTGENIKQNIATASLVHEQLVDQFGHLAYTPHIQDTAWSKSSSSAAVTSDMYQRRFNVSIDFLKNWASAVYRVPGRSWGSNREERIARDLGLPIYDDLAQVHNRLVPGVLGSGVTSDSAGLRGTVWDGNVDVPGVSR